MGIFVIAAGKNQRSTQPSALSVTGKGHKKIQILHRAFLVADHKIATWVLRAVLSGNHFSF
jgi:predicted homoserine dehydrogenase-like protein